MPSGQTEARQVDRLSAVTAAASSRGEGRDDLRGRGMGGSKQD